jgi:RNA polymerase sigma factor (sigma-70 family)
MSFGDSTAELDELRELVDVRLGRALRPFGRRGSQEREDLAQSVLLAVYEAVLDGTVPTDPLRRKRWIRGLASNAIRSWLRSESRNHPRLSGRGESAMVDPPDRHPDAQEAYEMEEESQATEAELARLTDAEREAFEAKMNAQSVEDIAFHIGRSVKATRSLIKRAVARLRRHRRGYR